MTEHRALIYSYHRNSEIRELSCRHIRHTCDDKRFLDAYFTEYQLIYYLFSNTEISVV